MMKQKKKQTQAVASWLRETTEKRKKYIILLTLQQTATSIGSVSYALFFRGVIDAAAAGEQQKVQRWILYFAALTILMAALGAVGRFLREYAQASMENELKKRMFQVLMDRSYEKFSAVHSGDWMNRLTSDTVVVAEGLTQILPGIAGMMIRLVGSLILLILLYPLFGIAVLAGGLLFLCVSALLRGEMKKLHRQVQEADGSLRIFLQESLENMLVVRCFGKEEQMAEQAEARMQEHKKKRMRRNHLSNFCSSGFVVAMNSAYVVGTAVGGYGILNGTLSYGTLIALVQLIGQLQSPLANITGFLPQYYAMTASAERLMEAEEYPKETEKLDEVPLDEVQSFYEKKLESFVLEKAVFSYPDTDGPRRPNPVLRIDGELLIPKGTFLALTGPSGCGKSTMLKLLMCLYPLESGARWMAVDGQKIPLTQKWRRLFAYVPQGNQLMSGTIREIVTFDERMESENEEVIWQALRIADAEQFVRNLPGRLDTRLGERGAGLSEGQTQRLAIARAVYAGNPVLMLDEATSALDEQTEQKVLQNLRGMTKKTVFIVTHRKAVLEFCDLELCFSENGITMQQGSGKEKRNE